MPPVYVEGGVCQQKMYIFSIDDWVHEHEEAINAFQLLIIMQILSSMYEKDE